MSILKVGDFLLGYSGEPYEVNTRMIASEQGICVVDEHGYIGKRVTNYFPHAGNTYYNNFAVVVSGADYSGLGLGQVMLLEEGTESIGGTEYRTVTIGGVTWMAENLDLKASSIDINGTGSPSTPAAWYYNCDEATYGRGGKKYGLLYNWYAVKHLQDNRSLLMEGWHLPSSAEWDALATAVGGAGTAGTKLKDRTFSGGTDDYGFSVLPAGGYYSGGFYDVGSFGNFWASTEYSSSNAYSRYFSSGASMSSDYYSKTNGISVRLVKDS